MVKRLLTLLLLLAVSASAQTPCGIEFTGSSNTNRPLSLFQNSMSHWSDSQVKPAAFSVSAGNLTGNGATSTATVGSDPTVGTNGVRLYVGMPIVVSGMSDSAANGNFIISSLTSSTISWASSFNGTTGGGTVASRMVGASTAVFPTTTGNSWTDPTTGCVWKLQYQRSDYGPNDGQVQLYYASRSTFSKDNTYFTLFQANHNDFISATATPGSEPVNNFGARLTTFSKVDDDYAYSMNGNTLRYTKISTSTTVSYTTFGGGLTNCKIGGEEGGLEVIGGKDVLPFVCDNGSNRSVFSYTINDRAASSPSGTQSCVYTTSGGAGVDNSHIDPSTGDVVVVFSSSGSGNDQGIGRVDTSGGTCNITHLNDTPGHGDIAVGYDDNTTYFVREINNSTSSCTTQGVVAIRLSDGAQTCILDRSTANSGTSASTFVLGGHVSGEAPGWVVISNYDSVVCRNEAGLGASWDSNIQRTSCGVAVCQVKASPSCWWLGNPKGATHSASSEFYWKMWKCAASNPQSGAASKSVPQYVICTSDGKHTTTATSNEAYYTVLVDFTNSTSPTLSSISPASGWRGAQIAVVFTGTNLDGASPQLNSTCGDVTFPSFVVNSATQITAQVLIAPGASGLTCNFSVTTANGTSETREFTVNAPPTPMRAVRVIF